MDLLTLINRGLTALRPTFAELESSGRAADDYVFALFNGGTRAGALVAATVLAQRIGTSGVAPSAWAGSGLTDPDGDDIVVAVVIDEPTLLATLTDVVASEALGKLRQWFVRANRRRTRIVAVPADATIYGVLVDRLVFAGGARPNSSRIEMLN